MEGGAGAQERSKGASGLGDRVTAATEASDSGSRSQNSPRPALTGPCCSPAASLIMQSLPFSPLLFVPATNIPRPVYCRALWQSLLLSFFSRPSSSTNLILILFHPTLIPASVLG